MLDARVNEAPAAIARDGAVGVLGSERSQAPNGSDALSAIAAARRKDERMEGTDV